MIALKKTAATLFVLFAGIISSAPAQDQHKMDSLYQVIRTSKDDSNKVKTLNKLSMEYRLVSKWDSAKSISETSISLAEKINYPEGKFKAFNGLGIVNRMHGNYKEALKYFSASLEYWQQTHNKESIAGANSNIGLVYWNEANYTEALKYYFSALKIDEEIGNKVHIAMDYTNIANVYSDQGNNKESLKYYSTALEIFNETGEEQLAATAYNNIGKTSVLLMDYPNGLKNFSAALKIYEKIGEKEGMAMVLVNLGEIYSHQGDYAKQLESVARGLAIAREIRDKRLEAAGLLNMGIVNTSLKKFDVAGKYLSDGLTLSKEYGINEFVKEIYFAYVTLDSTRGNYKQALTDYKMYSVYKDSLFNETSSRQTNEMKAKYESEKKDNEIIVLNKDKELQRLEIKKQKLLKNSLIGGLALMGGLVFLGYRTYRTRQKLKLQTLRNKIASDLHDDVGSTLSSIAIFTDIARQQTSEVTPMLEQIGDSSRKMLDAMADIVWTINPDNDQFERIILRMRNFAYELLGAKKIEFEFDADDDVTKMKLPMDVRKNLYLIFKEATNNMVKYAGADKASFSISGKKGNLTMLIRDNGKGFDTSIESKGNGLKNMRRRAAEIGAKLLIESEPGKGTTIQLLLNLA